jgi:hypothetical protein
MSQKKDEALSWKKDAIISLRFVRVKGLATWRWWYLISVIFLAPTAFTMPPKAGGRG